MTVGTSRPAYEFRTAVCRNRLDRAITFPEGMRYMMGGDSMSSDVLQIGFIEAGDTRTIKLTGELDAYTSERVSEISGSWVADVRKVVVDLDDLNYIDSAGLSALVGLWVAIRDGGAQMTVTCNNARIHRVLDVTGLSNLFTIRDGSPNSSLNGVDDRS